MYQRTFESFEEGLQSLREVSYSAAQALDSGYFNYENEIAMRPGVQARLRTEDDGTWETRFRIIDEEVRKVLQGLSLHEQQEMFLRANAGRLTPTLPALSAVASQGETAYSLAYTTTGELQFGWDYCPAEQNKGQHWLFWIKRPPWKEDSGTLRESALRQGWMEVEVVS